MSNKTQLIYKLDNVNADDGVDIFEIENKFGKEYINYFLKEIDTYINQNLVSLIDKKYILTNEGKFIGDSIASDLFFVK